MKKHVRVRWKLLGKDALKWACTTADLALPGAGTAARLVAEYVDHLQEEDDQQP